MSGGAYDYAYSKIYWLADEIKEKAVVQEYGVAPFYRKEFKAHLRLVAEACRAIELNDSGDGDKRERELVLRCLEGNSDPIEADW